MTSIDLAHPHDHLVRRFLVDTELMADLLAYYPQKIADQKAIGLLDLKHLACKSPVAIDKNLAEGRGDLRFATTFKGSKRQSNVFLLLEHQSAIDHRMRLRGLKYIVQMYDQVDAAHKGKLPYPVVVVLYHGKISWKHIPEMDDMIDTAPGAETGLLKDPLILIDLSVIPAEKFAGHPALRALLETLQRTSEGKLVKEFDRITDYFTPVKNDLRTRDWIHSLVRYAMSVGKIGTELIVKAYSKVFDEREAQKMAQTTAQELLLEGKTEGIAEGIAKGKAESGRNMVLTALRTKFGRIPKDVEKAVLAMSDPIALESLLAQAIQSDTMDEFAEVLK
jgi:predicted transposase/invertase (TIGR01784 family)